VRPGRPEKRQAIIEAAQRVFLRHGYTDTSVDAIAAESGVSKQTIYNHFGDKKNLFLAVINEARTDVARTGQQRFEAEIKEVGDLEVDLRAAAMLWIDLMLDETVAGLRRIVLAEYVRHPELINEWARPDILEGELTQEIEKHVQQGHLDIDDMPRAAHQLVLLTAVEAIQQSRNGLRRLSPAEIEKIVDDGVGMWLRCYRSRPC
jgi:AcrR family transcriptional regulator